MSDLPTSSKIRSIGDLLRRLGDIPPDRVRFQPIPGTATIADLLEPENEFCELVDGTLVEKPMGQEEAFFGGWIFRIITNFVYDRNLGYTTPGDGFTELPGGPVRGPDVSFFAWSSLPNRRRPTEPFPLLAPDLVVEVLSPSNTKAEMARKRSEYFQGGVRLYWEFDPPANSLRVYTSLHQFRDLASTDVLDGGNVLPGFSIPVADLWAELDRHG